MSVDMPDLAWRLRLEAENTFVIAGIKIDSENADLAFGELQNAFEEVLDEILLDIEVGKET